MTPTLCTQIATRLHPVRWLLLGVSLALVAAVWVSVFTLVATERVSLPSILSVATPMLAVLWAVVCCTFWFHPERGTLRADAPALRRMPSPVRVGLRWYAAVFLVFFAVAGVVGPLLMLRAG
jgi:hypothetical protein